MSSISELKSSALRQLKGNWNDAVIISLIFIAISAVFHAPQYLGVPVTFSFFSFLIVAPVAFGFYKFFLKLKRGEPKEIKMLFDGFNIYLKTLGVYFKYVLFVFLWTLLLIVPGIIAALAYSQAWFILVDEPEIPTSEALYKSKLMMHGYKWLYFKMWFSFIGWGLLCVLTAGIGFLWLFPYIYTTFANFYDELKST